jgi:LysM repeat protein
MQAPARPSALQDAGVSFRTTQEALIKREKETELKRLILGTLTTVLLTLGLSTQAQSLRGSAASVERQNQLAVAYGYTFVETAQTMNRLVSAGQLVRVSPTRYMDLHDVSFPFARSGVKVFVNRLSAQYYNACGEKLTVTSLSRPIDQQPANAAARSVHPAGMAVDLRIPKARQCRAWLERTLLSLEAKGVLDVTRERRPPHYHVAVFVESYETYVASMTIGGTSKYVVRSGDTLSSISDLTGVSVAQLRAENNLRGDLIHAGQELQIPPSANGNASIAKPNQVAAVTRITHKVRSGETLWRIGNRYGTSVSRIMMENELDDDMLQVGQELRISAAR